MSGRQGRGGRARRAAGGSRAVVALITGGALSLALAGCGDLGPTETRTFTFGFNAGDLDFIADFTDFPVEQEEEVDFVANWRPLPEELADQGSALYHRGFNLSDALFMYFKRRVAGLAPGARYRATFSLEFASNAGQDCEVGVAVNVWLKTGASTEQPVRVVEEEGAQDWYFLSVDKGFQMNEGENALLLGDMRNGLPGCGPEVPWATRALTSGDRAIEVTADSEGGLWLFFGSESGFEVTHELYFLRFEAVLERL